MGAPGTTGFSKGFASAGFGSFGFGVGAGAGAGAGALASGVSGSPPQALSSSAAVPIDAINLGKRIEFWQKRIFCGCDRIPVLSSDDIAVSGQRSAVSCQHKHCRCRAIRFSRPREQTMRLP
ncbi:MAG: hypothetical protein F6J93_17110 [Oscillatoria sp. SIO1A7]|nr:hypothetical protein [Oscillatoria sp. SIO1A7]